MNPGTGGDGGGGGDRDDGSRDDDRDDDIDRGHDTGDGDANSDRDDDRVDDDGPLGSLLELLEMLAEMEERGERRRDGRLDIGGTSVDFSVGIGTLDDLADRGGRGPRDSGDRSSGGGERDGDAAADDGAHVDVRRTEAGATVVADLPDVDAGAVDVAVDEGADRLRILVDGEPVGTAPLSGEELSVTDATVRNEVLEVRLERVDHDT